MTTIALPSRWPGWGAADTLVIPVDPRDWPLPTDAPAIDGRVLAPKRELHVTVVGKALGAKLREAIGDGRLDEAQLRAAFSREDWRLQRSGQRIHLRKPGGDVESIIEPVALPAMARFHAWLGDALGVSLPVPPPHVTLYVHGDAEGIGVPDEATLENLRVP